MKNAMDVFQSIKRTNGATYSLSTGQLNPLIGYMVALPGWESIEVPPDNLIDFNELVDRYISGKEAILNQRNRFIGFWLKDDKLYIDVSELFLNKQDAINAGIARNQQAIWDNMSMHEIITSTGNPQTFPKEVELFR